MCGVIFQSIDFPIKFFIIYNREIYDYHYIILHYIIKASTVAQE